MDDNPTSREVTRRLSPTGASASARISARLRTGSADWSGKPRSAVSIELAWTSTPDIGLEEADVVNTSLAIGAVTPTRTILPAKAEKGTAPSSTSAIE